MKPKTDLERIAFTLAGYAGVFFWALTIPTVALSVLTDDPFYPRAAIGLAVGGACFTTAWAVVRVADFFDD